MPNVLLSRPPDSGRQTLEEYRAEGGYSALAAALKGAGRSGAAGAISTAETISGALSPSDVVRIITEADLRGRGGAAFPTGRKWALAAAAEDSPKYVVANGGEHEPGSGKDRLLVSDYPHKVLEGVALCAYGTGASAAYLYLIEDMTDAIESARLAIEEATRAGLIGPGAWEAGSSSGPGTGTSRPAAGLEVNIVTAPTTYVAGEETAALEVIEGRKAWPRKKPPYPGQAGLFGKPTTVNNVETLAHVPGIVRNGAAWFRGLGLAGGAGTMLFTLDERAVRPGVYELPVGTSFRRLLYDHGGGPRSGRPVRAILPALSSSFLGSEHLDLPATHDALKQAGSGLGCGGVSFLEDGECIVERVVEIAEFFMREQCGQCPPCRMETNTLAAILEQVRDGQAGDYVTQIEKVTAFTRGKGYCSLIEMAAAPVLSALRLFPEDFAHHAAHGACPSP